MQLSYPALAILGFGVTMASLFGTVALHVARILTKKYDVELTIADRLIVYPADATPDEIVDRVIRALSRS